VRDFERMVFHPRLLDFSSMIVRVESSLDDEHQAVDT
jgi:hypothetical protein